MAEDEHGSAHPGWRVICDSSNNSTADGTPTTDLNLTVLVQLPVHTYGISIPIPPGVSLDEMEDYLTAEWLRLFGGDAAHEEG